MMKKAFIYMVLAIRAVFLSGINFCEALFGFISKPSKFLLRTSVVALIILSSFNFEVSAQGNNCPPGQRYCRGECRPARQCGGPPPPPGLPIDSKLPYLLIAGLGLGIYYLKSKKAA